MLAGCPGDVVPASGEITGPAAGTHHTREPGMPPAGQACGQAGDAATDLTGIRDDSAARGPVS